MRCKVWRFDLCKAYFGFGGMGLLFIMQWYGLVTGLGLKAGVLPAIVVGVAVYVVLALRIGGCKRS